MIEGYVIAGDYTDYQIAERDPELKLVAKEPLFGKAKGVLLNKDTIESYQVIDKELKVFAIGSSETWAKVAIQFKDGKRSLIKMNNRTFDELLIVMF